MKQGQAVLIVLLVGVVALAFGLAIISQSTTDIKVSEQEDQASRAFNAAEAGIEQGLKTLVTGAPLNINGMTVNYSVTGVNVLETTVAENDVATVMLNGATTISLNWGDACPTSLEIAVVAADGSVTRYGKDPCGSGKGMDDLTGLTAGDTGYLEKFTFPVQASDRLIRIRPLDGQTKLMVYGSSTLPPQAYQINSSTQAVTLESKAIAVSRTEPAAPAIFDYVLFSGTDLVQ